MCCTINKSYTASTEAVTAVLGLEDRHSDIPVNIYPSKGHNTAEDFNFYIFYFVH